VGVTIHRIWRGASPRSATYQAVLEVALFVSIASVLIVTLPSWTGAERTLTLVPFGEFRYTTAGGRLIQLTGNALLFLPLGFLAPLRWPRFDSFRTVVLAAGAFSLAIEVLQFALPAGRQTSVTDVIMNTGGAAVGYALMLAVRGLVRRAYPVRLSA
jgi:glycopeptide antibiotics resistance protein